MPTMMNGTKRTSAVAQRDDDARRQRQLGAEAGEQVGEGRNDLPQNDADDDGGDDDDRDRIDHRGLDLALQLDVLLDVGREALENRVEDAARLARGNHVGEQRVEGLRMLLHRVGERRAALDVAARREDDRGEVLVLFLRAEDLEALHQRQAGVDHHRELAREDGQVLGVDALGFASARLGAAAFSLTGLILRDEHLLAAQRGDGGIHRVGDALAGDGLARRASVR